jgi:hypothetical protein
LEVECQQRGKLEVPVTAHLLQKNGCASVSPRHSARRALRPSCHVDGYCVHRVALASINRENRPRPETHLPAWQLQGLPRTRA